MFRSVFGFAVFAVLAWLGLKLVFSVLGGLIGLAMTVLWLAAIGFIIYRYGKQGAAVSRAPQKEMTGDR